VHVKVDDRAAFDVIGLMAQRASHEIAPLAEVRITVLGSARIGFDVFDGADHLAAVGTPEEALDCVFARVYRRAVELASLKGWLRVHGAVAGADGHRVAVVGPAGAGKTTLAVGLLCEGAAVEVDESFVIRDGEVMGVARRLHAQPGTFELVTSASWAADAPAFGRSPVRLVDPTEHGFPWALPRAPIEHVMVLRRTEGPSRMEPAPAALVVQEVIRQAFPVLEPRRVAVRQAANLASSAHCHSLHAGPDGRAPRLVMDLVDARPVS